MQTQKIYDQIDPKSKENLKKRKLCEKVHDMIDLSIEKTFNTRIKKYQTIENKIKFKWQVQ